jgi:Flp pilus assembly protein TadD
MDKRIAALILVLASIAGPAMGQAGHGRGRLAGTVTDDKGRPVPSARIIIGFLEKAQPRWSGATESGIRHVGEADAEGHWRFLGLGTGWWRVEIAAEGYAPASIDRFVMQLYDSPPLRVKVGRPDAEGTSPEPGPRGKSAGALFNLKGPDNLNYEKILVQDEDPDAAALALASIRMENGEVEAAAAEFARIAERVGDDPMRPRLAAAALAGRGEALLRLGDRDGAREALFRSFKLNPRSEITAFDLGEIDFAARRIEEAAFYYGEAIRLSPDWSDPWEKLGAVWMHKGDWKRAEDSLRRFLALEPEGVRALRVGGLLKELERVRKEPIFTRCL